MTQIGLFQLPTGVLSTTQSTSGTDEGATRMLTQLKHQFDVVSEATDLRLYELVILPDASVERRANQETARDRKSVV